MTSGAGRKPMPRKTERWLNMLQILSLPLAEKAGWGAGEVSIFFADFNNGSLQNFSLVHGRAAAGIKSSPAGRFCQFNPGAGETGGRSQRNSTTDSVWPSEERHCQEIRR